MGVGVGVGVGVDVDADVSVVGDVDGDGDGDGDDHSNDGGWLGWFMRLDLGHLRWRTFEPSLYNLAPKALPMCPV